MQITQLLSWPSTNWPSSSASTQYTVLQLYPLPSGQTTPTVITTVQNATSAQITYDDSQNLLFQIRPSSGSGSNLTYGPEVLCSVIGYVPCRAWLRQKIRYAVADRADVGGNVILNWSDGEINGYIEDALNEFNILFPNQEETIISMQPMTVVNGEFVGVRDYALPSDFYTIRSVEYITVDGKLHLFLKEKSFRGGESTATSYYGYPKLGILINPTAGRFYPGNFDIYEDQIHIDWDPAGDGDYLHLRYLARRPLPTSDSDLLSLNPEDLNLLSMRAQMSCWLRLEGNDTRLSRFRDKNDGSRRDDMPTQKMSFAIKQLYNELVNDRRQMRPKGTRRLVRR